MNRTSRRSLLNGVRVVDFSWLMAGPSGTLMLALAGADVIRIESTRSLDNYRKSFAKGGNPDLSYLFATVNMAKRSVLIDLKASAGLAIVRDLVERADVVVENFTPGTMTRLGVGYEALSQWNPGLVMISASAAGQTGPKRHFAGYAPHFAALAGLSYLTGYADGPPARFGRSLDARVGNYIALAAIVGLLYRRRTGEGLYLDISDQEVVASLLGDVLADAARTGREFYRNGNAVEGQVGTGCYPCQGRDQWVAVEVASNVDWLALCHAIVRPDLAGDRSLADERRRNARRQEIEAAIAQWTIGREKHEAVRQLQEAGVRATAVANALDLFQDAQLHDRGIWRHVEHGALGPMWVVDSPITRTPADEQQGEFSPAPLLGEHTDEVLKEVLGLDAERLASLHQAGAFK